MTDYGDISAYDYDLPLELVAGRPTRHRAQSRLLDGRSQPPVERSFAELDAMLRPGDLIVLNDARVVSARIQAHKRATGGAVELFATDVEHPGGDDRWTAPTNRLVLKCMTRSSKPVRVGAWLDADGASFEVLAADSGHARVATDASGRSAAELLESIGATPLPPYILRRRMEAGLQVSADTDSARYQTVFADQTCAVAAPTAGLHFDADLLQRLQRAGVRIARLTLAVGPGTFRPVLVDRLDDHQMHTERYRIGHDLGDAIAETRAGGGRIIAVGTTSLRALEAEARREQPFEPGWKETDLFVRPGFEFGVVDCLLTNFHLPRSTLLALVYAFAGPEHVRALYQHAISQGYRFYSYGDAMLLQRGS